VTQDAGNPFDALARTLGPPKSIADNLGDIADMIDWIRCLSTERSGLDPGTQEELGIAYDIIVEAICSLSEAESE
jgi:hypothetical protein